MHRLEPLSPLLRILVWDGADEVVAPAVLADLARVPLDEDSSRGSGIWRRPAIAPQAGQQCCASLVVAHDLDDSEHNHDSHDDLDDKPEATTLLAAAALTVSHWRILAITGQQCGRAICPNRLNSSHDNH